MTRIALHDRVVLWNLGAFGLTALAGFAINVSIARWYQPGNLGTFNTVFAVYIILSQVAVLGVHQAVGKYVAEDAHSEAEKAGILGAGLAVAGVVAAAVSVVGWVAAPALDRLFSCSDFTPGLRAAAPGLFFFALNKVFLLYLNGLMRLRLLAALQAVRAVAMLASCAYLVWQGRPVHEVCGCLFHAEAVLFAASVLAALALGLRPSLAAARSWLRRLLAFGAHATPGALCVESNTRIDILMLNFFLTDYLVGIYSFCALFGEGLYQLNLVFSAIYNPQVSRMYAAGEREELAAFVRHQRNRLWALFAVLCVLAALAYPWLADLASGHPEYRAGWACFIVMMAGLWCASGYLPFNQLLLQAGRPAWHSYSLFAAVASNVLVSALAIGVLKLGVVGAALGMVVSWNCQLLVVACAARARLGLKV